MADRCLTKGEDAKFDPAGKNDNIQIDGVNLSPLEISKDNENLQATDEIRYKGVNSQDLIEGMSIKVGSGNKEEYIKEQSVR